MTPERHGAGLSGHGNPNGHHCHGCGTSANSTRRGVLAGLAAGGIAALAGCLGDDDESGEPPEPIGLDGNQECDVCGMLIDGNPGPNGQVFFDGDVPPERDGPAWYDSVRELYVDRFTQEGQGETPFATYVTDYSAVDWSVEETDGTKQISGHTEADGFVPDDEVTFVVESDVEGVMGSDLLPFSDETDSEAFIDEYGGRQIVSADVDQSLLDDLS